MSVEHTPQRNTPYKLDHTSRKKLLIDWTSVKEDEERSQEKSPVISRLKKKIQKNRKNEVSSCQIFYLIFITNIWPSRLIESQEPQQNSQSLFDDSESEHEIEIKTEPVQIEKPNTKKSPEPIDFRELVDDNLEQQKRSKTWFKLSLQIYSEIL